MTPRQRLAVLASPLLVASCISGRSPYSDFYLPALPERPAPKQPADDAPRLRFRGLHAVSHIKAQIIWRTSDVEVGAYALRRWLEHPSKVAERELAARLFEGRGLRRVTSAAAATLECELRVFEEVLLPDHAVQIELWVSLMGNDSGSLLERTFKVRRPVPSNEDPADTARAMGKALHEILEEVADAIVEAL